MPKEIKLPEGFELSQSDKPTSKSIQLPKGFEISDTPEQSMVGPNLQLQKAILTYETAFGDEEAAKIEQLPITDFEKDWLKKAKIQIGQKRDDGTEFTIDEYENSKKVLTGEHQDLQSGLGTRSTYYWDKDGLPKPLKYGEKPPVDGQIQGIWGSQQESNDDTGLTTFAKSLWNGFAGIVALPAEVIGLGTLAVTGENSEFAQAANNTVDRFKFAVSQDSQKELVNEEAFKSVAGFFNSDNWNLNAQNIIGMIGQGIGSLAQFLVGGAEVKGVKYGIKAAMKGTKYADEVALAAEKTGNWLSKNKDAITASSLVSLHEASNAADVAGLTGREKAAFVVTTSIGNGFLEMIGGADVALLNKIGVGAKKEIAEVAAKEFIKDGAVVSAKSLKNVFEQTIKKGSSFLGVVANEGKGEALEEVSQTYFTALSADTYRTLDGTTDFKSDLTAAKTMKDAFEGGLVGFALGAGMTSVNSDARQEAQLDNAYKMIKAGKETELLQQFNNLKASGDLSPIEYENITKKVGEVKEYIAKFKEEKLTDIEEKRAVDVLMKADNLEAEIDAIKNDDTLSDTQKEAKAKAYEVERKSYVNDLQAVYSGEYLKQEVKKQGEAIDKTIKNVKEAKAEFDKNIANLDKNIETLKTNIESPEKYTEILNKAKSDEPASAKTDSPLVTPEVAVEPVNSSATQSVNEVAGEVKSKYKGKIIYATPSSGKSTLVKNNPEQFVDGDELLLAELKTAKIPNTEILAYPQTSAKTLNADLRSAFNTLGAPAAQELYDKAFAQAETLKAQGKTVLFGSHRLIPKVDAVITSSNAQNIKNKIGEKDYEKFSKQEQIGLAKRADKPIQLKDENFIGDELLNPKDILGAGINKESPKDTETKATTDVSAPGAKPKAIVPEKRRFSQKGALSPDEAKKAGDKLRELADKVNSSSKDVDEFFKGVSSALLVPKPIITGALKTVEVALRTGASFADAVESAIKWISDNYDKWTNHSDDEKEEFKKKLTENIYNYLNDTNDAREKIANDKTLTDKEKSNLTIQTFSMSDEDLNKIVFGDGIAKFNKLNSKIRDMYEGIEGFADDYEIEKLLGKIAKDNAEYSTDITFFVENLINSDNQKIQAIGKRLKGYANSDIVSLMNFFRSITPQPYTHIEHTKNNQYVIHQSNNSFEEELKNAVYEAFGKMSDEEYNKKRIAHSKQPKSFQSDVDYLVELTGIEAKHWKNFPNSPAIKADYQKKHKQGSPFAKDQATYNKNLLNNFIIQGGIPGVEVLDTKEKFLKNLTRAKSSGKGSVINTMYLGTPDLEKLNYLKKGFKNTEWKSKNSYAMKSGITISASIIASPEVQNNSVWKNNGYVKFNKDSKIGASIQYINGMFSSSTKNKKASGNLTSDDIQRILVENYKLTESNSDSYYQPLGQMSDSEMIPMIQVKRYTDIKQATEEYKNRLQKDGWSVKAIENRMKEMRIEANSYKSFVNNVNFPGTTVEEKSGLFVVNYALNDYDANEYYNGLTSDYGKKYDNTIESVKIDDKWIKDPLRKIWQRELQKDIAKRNGSTKSPGISLDTNIPNGVGKTHKMIVIQTSKEDIKLPELGEVGEVSIGDGGSFVSRNFSDKANVSSGSRYKFNTLLKGIVSVVMPNGRRLLDKTHSITIDELADLLPDSQFKKIAKFMQDNGIDKITTQDGAKKTAGYPIFDLFGGETFDATKHVIEVSNENLLIQQDLSNDGKFYEDKTPVQVQKNEMVSANSTAIAELYSEVANKKIAEYVANVLSKDDEGIRDYILKDLGIKVKQTSDEEDTQSDEDAEESNQEHIFKLLQDKSIPLLHHELSNYIINYISNLFTTNALGRRSSKGIFVAAPNYNLELKSVRSIKGKVLLPEIAISENAELRGPKGYATKNEALLAAMKYEDMSDIKGALLEHEIEKIGNEWVVPGEYVKVSRVPADASHSTFVGRVKHLIPGVAKNLIITPKEMMFIAGEDFDGDARQVESFFKKNDKNTGEVTTEFKEGDYRNTANEAFKMSIEWYYDEKNIKEHLTPIDKEKLKPLLNKLEQNVEINANSPASYMKLRELYQVGLKVVGSMATMQSVGDFIKKHNTTLNKAIALPTIRINKNGKPELKAMKSVNSFDKDPESKANYANVQNLAVDNGKELAIELLGLNEVTVNAYSTLLMLNGGDTESAAGLFTHSIVKEFIQRVRNNQSVEIQEKSKNDIIKAMAEEIKPNSTGKKGEWFESNIPFDLNNDFSVLHKLNQIDAISYDLGIIQKAIKANDKAANTFTDLYSQKNGITSTLNYSFEEANDISQIKHLDVTGFANSPYFNPGIAQVKAMTQMFNRYGFHNSTKGREIINHFESLKGTIDKPMKLSSKQIGLLSKAIDDLRIVSARNITDGLSIILKRLTTAIENGQKEVNSKSAALWDVLEVVSKSSFDKAAKDDLEIADTRFRSYIQLKQDIKKGDLNETENKAIESAIDALPVDIKKDLIDYATVWYKLSSSTQSGSYASFFSSAIQKEIGEQLQKEKEKWDMPGNTERLIAEIFEQNPELDFRGEKKNSPYKKIYEPNVNKSKTITANTQALVDKMENNNGILISESSGKFDEYNKLYPGDTLIVDFNGKKVSKKVIKKRIVVLGKLSNESAREVSVTTGNDMSVFLEQMRAKSNKKAVLIEFELAALSPQFSKSNANSGNISEQQFREIADKLVAQNNTKYEIHDPEFALDLLEMTYPKQKGQFTAETVPAFYANGLSIIPSNYLTAETAFHEIGGHPFVDAICSMNTPLFNNLKKQLEGSANGRNLIAEVKKGYTELLDSKGELTEKGWKEAITTSLGRLADNQLSESKDKSLITALKQLLKRIGEYMAKLFSSKGNAIEPINLKATTTLKQLAKMLALDAKINVSNTVSNQKDAQLSKRNNIAIIKDQLQKASNKIDFDEKSHTYKVNGKVLESVTTGIKQLEDYSYSGPESNDFEKNSEMGKQIHKLSEDIAKGVSYSKLEESQTWAATKSIFDTAYNYLKALNDSLIGDVLPEVKLASVPNTRAGSADMVHIKGDGSLDIYDIKTSVKSTQSTEYNREYNGKKSKHDKHGIQLATYANMLEIGDKETGLLAHEIDQLHVIPFKIKIGKNDIGNDTVTSLEIEPLQSFGYSKYKKEARRILTEQPKESTQKEIQDDFDSLSGAEITYESYMAARQFDLAQHDNILSELSGEKGTEIAGANRESVLKDIQNQIDEILLAKKEMEKDYDKYKRDRILLKSMYAANKEDLDLKKNDLKELVHLYFELSKYDQVARMKFFEIVKNNIGWKMANLRAEDIKKIMPDYDLKLHRNEDLSGKDVMMKALSDFTEKNPEFQFLDQLFKEHINEKNIALEQHVKNSEKLAKAVIAEYNEKHGIKEKASQYLDPLANNAKYFSYLEDPDNKGFFRQVKDKSLTEAQNALLEHILKEKNQIWVKNIMLKGSDQQWNDKQIIKKDPKVSETYKAKGIFAAWTQYLRQGQGVNSVRIYFKDPKTGITRLTKYSDIELLLARKASENAISKIEAAIQLKRANTKAVNQLQKGLNEDGSQLDVDLRGDFNISSDGRLLSKFSLNSNKDGDYSKDFYGAHMNFMQDMIFIKHMEPLVPYIDGIDQYNRFAGKNKDGEYIKKNTLKAIEIFKRGKILRETIVGPGGKKMDDVLKFFRVWTFINVMSFNIPANIFNLILGKYNDFIHGSGIGALSFKGERLMLKNKTKALSIVNRYHASGFELDLNPNGSIGKFFTGLMFGAGKLTEQWVRNSSFLGYMTDAEYALFDESGEFKESTTEEQKELMNKKAIEYKKKIGDVQGKYSEEESRNFGHFEMGKSIGQFKVWMPDAWNTRFAAKYINSNNEVTIGTMNSLIHQGFRDAYKDVLKKEFYTSNKAEYVQARRNFKEVMSFSLILSLAASASDDKEDKMLSDNMWRLFSEASSMYNLKTYEYLLTSPVPGMRTATSLIKTMEQAFDTYGSKGYYGNKGDFKIVHNSFKLLPYHKIIEYPVAVFTE